MNNRKSTR